MRLGSLPLALTAPSFSLTVIFSFLFFFSRQQLSFELLVPDNLQVKEVTEGVQLPFVDFLVLPHEVRRWENPPRSNSSPPCSTFPSLEERGYFEWTFSAHPPFPSQAGGSLVLLLFPHQL